MEQFFKIFLALHITSGTIGLLSGTINIVRKKGDKLHKRIGKVFLYGMLSTGLTALILASLHQSPFLFIVGILTIYQVGTGQRYLSLKNFANGQKPLFIDWTLTLTMLLAGIIILCWGLFILINGTGFGIVLMLFGFAGIGGAKKDYQNYKGNVKSKNYWLTEHIQRMTGGYVAAFTALLVVNGHHFTNYLSPTAIWLLPTVLFVPLSIYWTRKHKIELR